MGREKRREWGILIGVIKSCASEILPRAKRQWPVYICIHAYIMNVFLFNE